MSAALVAHALSHGFGAHSVFDDLDVTVAAGEAALLLGPNGAGKSTLLALFAGLLRPRAGRATIDGIDARDPAARIGLGAALAGALPPRRTPAQLAAALGSEAPLAALGVEALRDQRCGRLSAGQRDRVRIALALGCAARVLLLDEPLAHLDAEGQERVVAAVRQLHASGRTVLIATHHPDAWRALDATALPLSAGTTR